MEEQRREFEEHMKQEEIKREQVSEMSDYCWIAKSNPFIFADFPRKAGWEAGEVEASW